MLLLTIFISLIFTFHRSASRTFSLSFPLHFPIGILTVNSSFLTISSSSCRRLNSQSVWYFPWSASSSPNLVLVRAFTCHWRVWFSRPSTWSSNILAMNSLQVVFSDNDDSFLNLLIQDPPSPPSPVSLVVFLLVHVFACLNWSTWSRCGCSLISPVLFGVFGSDHLNHPVGLYPSLLKSVFSLFIYSIGSGLHWTLLSPPSCIPQSTMARRSPSFSLHWWVRASLSICRLCFVLHDRASLVAVLDYRFHPSTGLAFNWFQFSLVCLSGGGPLDLFGVFSSEHWSVISDSSGRTGSCNHMFLNKSNLI